MSDKWKLVIDRIDALNREDPNKIETSSGPQAYEYIYSQWLTDWVLKLNPGASELLKITARGQHVGRWKIPRSSYEATRGGYLRWREDLKKMHAETVGKIMEEAGYGKTEIEQVRFIIIKKNIKTDPSAQTIEDALCLVFLEHQFKDLFLKTPPEKMRDIVRKTWRKMSTQGQSHVLEMPLSLEEKNFLQDCLV